MTTYFPFIPRAKPPTPSFQPTLDGSIYTITLNANLFGQRYYLLCTDGLGNTIFNEPLIATPPSAPISTLSWSVTMGVATVTMVNPHLYPLGSSASLTIEGASPTTWNGTYYMLATGPSTLTFPLMIDPGTMLSPGSLSYLISICAGYFNSTLIFRNGSFEVNP